MLKKFFFFLLIWSPLNLINSTVQACSVCFGGAGSNLTRGFFWGIIVLLALPFVLIGLITTLIFRASKNPKNHAHIS